MPFTNLTHHKHFKTVVFVFLFIFFSINSRAQISQNGIYFQAIAKDNFDHPANRRNIYIQSNVIQSSSTGPKVLIEEFQTITDEAGIFTITIGKGIRKGGLVNTLSQIDWANGPFFLNLKIVITPIAPAALWDYSKEWIDLGTTPFGTVPYALYAGSAAGLNDKLSISDTSSMLAIYAKAQAIKSLENSVSTKIASTDTAAMLAPYKKMVNEIIASNITSLTAGSINTALSSKVNVADSAIVYITPMQLKSVKFDTTSIVQRIDTKLDKVTGIAGSATKLATARNINGVAFDGSGDITITSTADAGTLTGTTLKSTVTGSSLTSVGTITSGVWSGTAVAIQKGGTGLTTVGTNGQVLTSNGTSITWATPASSSSSSPTYTTGLNSDLGGYVFFLSTDSKHGLVAETQDQSTPTTWYYAEDKISDQANHSTNGKKFTDWRLPTKHELNLMYLVKNSVGGFANYYYWSSPEYDISNAWNQDFTNGYQYVNLKNRGYYVRAVRAF